LLLHFCVSYAQQTLADPLKFALVSADITPPQMDYYQDLNQNQRFDADEPWGDRNGNGVFDPIYLAGFSQNRMATGVNDPPSPASCFLFSRPVASGVGVHGLHWLV
jgi:hypothetical protein